MDARLRLFLAVARAGKLTEASRQLNISASALSAQVAALEQELGVSLFVRGSRGMQLTPAGELLAARAQDMEGQWLKTLRDVALVARGEQRVHLAASQTAAELFLPAPLGRFRSRFADIQIRLSMGNTLNVMQWAEARTVDVGIIEGGIVYGSLTATNMWDDELGLIVSTRHPLATRQAVAIDDMVGLALILREPGSGTRRIFERALNEAGWSLDSLNVIMELSSLRAILAMVAHNVGASIVSNAVMKASAIRVEGVAWLPVRGLELTRRIQLVMRADLTLTPALTALIEEFRRDAHARQRAAREPRATRGVGQTSGARRPLGGRGDTKP
jgi:DNA-binding transcriptional LysR family regulator